MVETHHISPRLLQHFANGRLNQTECELILCHLAECVHCLKVIDGYWSSLPENKAAALPPNIARRLEQAIFQQIQ